MRKLGLDPETLVVETFAVAPGVPQLRGTVRAAEMLATHALYCTNGDTCRTSCGRVGDCTCPPPAG
jgi:hypothetical protein